MRTTTISITRYVSVLTVLGFRGVLMELFQVIGIKSNFAQPFFVHWDTLMGTRMTRSDIELRKKKQAGKTE